MKKIILLSIVIILFVGCDMAHDVFFNIELGYHKIYRNDAFDGLDTAFECGQFLKANIKYVSRIGQLTQSPQETWEKKSGCCRDFSVLFCNIMFINTGIKWDAVAVDHGLKRTIVNGGDTNHVIVCRGKTYIEPQHGSIVEYEKYGYLCDFDWFLYE